MNVTIQKVLSKSCETLPSGGDFSDWARAISAGRQEVCVRIVDDDEAQALNFKYRKKAYTPNVLAFPFVTPLPNNDNYLGDVVLAAQQVTQEAQARGLETRYHWAHLFIHGVLHLQGYDHHCAQQEQVMRHQEIMILKKLNIPSPYKQELSN